MTDGIRTHDNQNHNLGLYQLSYGHHENFLPRKRTFRTCVPCRLACREGIEPPTHSLEGCCSIRLSYRQLRLTLPTQSTK